MERLQKNNIPVVQSPGIPSFIAAAASAGLSLISQNERLVVLPGDVDIEVLRRLLTGRHVVVVMKVSQCQQVLKDYLLKGYSINQRIERLEQRVSRTEDKIDFFVRTSLPACSGHTHQRLCLGARHSVANQDFVALRNSLFYLPLYIGHCATHHCQHAHISPKTLHRFR